MSSSSHFVTAHVGSKFLAMTLFPTLCTGGRVRWRHNQIFWHQVAVRWPSRDSRRSSQSEFLKIRVDLNTSLQQVLCCACYDLGSRPAKCSRSSWRFSISFQCLKLMSFRIYAPAPPPFIDSRFRKTVLLGHFLLCLLANPSFLRYSTFLCRLHTDKFPQSVVSDFERSFVKNEKTWVWGPTLAALRELQCVYRSRIRWFSRIVFFLWGSSLTTAGYLSWFQVRSAFVVIYCATPCRKL